MSAYRRPADRSAAALPLARCERLEGRRLLAAFRPEPPVVAHVEVPVAGRADLAPDVASPLVADGLVNRPAPKTVRPGAEVPTTDKPTSPTPEGGIALILNGTTGPDSILMAISGANIVVSVNGVTGSYSDATYESVTLNGLGGNDIITVNTNGLNPVTVNGGAADDTVRLAFGSGNLDDLDAAVVANGDGGADRVEFWDDLAPATFNDSYTVTSGSFDRSFYEPTSYSGVETLVVQGQPGSNALAADALLFETSLLFFGRDGDDGATLAPTAGDMDDLDGTTSFYGGAGADALVLNDANETIGDAFSAAVFDATLGTYLYDRAAFGGAVADEAVETVRLLTGGGNDSVAVEALPIETRFEVLGGAEDDTVNVAPTGQFLDTVDGVLSFDGEAGADALVANDGLNAFNDAFTLTPSTIDRPAFGSVEHASTVESVTLNAGTGGNSVDVQGNRSTTTLTLRGGAGDDAFRLGGITGGNLDGFGPTVVDGEAGAGDTLQLDDAANFFGDVYTATGSTVTRNFFGGATYAGLEGLTLDMQAGNSTVLVVATSVPTTLNGGAGNNLFLVGSSDGAAPGNLDVLGGALTVNGNGGGDTLQLDDRANLFADSATITATSYDRSFAQPVSYATVEALTLDAGGNDDLIAVTDTAPGVVTRVLGNGGADTLVVDATSAEGVRFVGGAGADDLSLTSNASPGRVILEGTDDLDAVAVGNGKVLALVGGGPRYAVRVNGLTAAPGEGRVELNDHGLVLDYAAPATPAADVRAAIINARSGGTWLGGSGITTADPTDGAPQPALAVGYAEATAAGTFLGAAHDATAVLVRATLPGDANLDGAVNFTDLSRVALNYGATIARWDAGDFNYSGAVTFPDLSAQAVNYGTALPAPLPRAAATVAADVLGDARRDRA